MKNLELLEEILLSEHEAEAEKQGAVIRNFGWAQDDFGICSKTSKGLLDSQIDPDTQEVRHEWN